MNIFPQLSPNARVWVYQANRPLTNDEVGAINSKASEFVKSWVSHARKVLSAAAVLHNRFIILAADEEQFNVSGCGIDSSVHFIKQLGEQYQIDFFDRFNTAYIMEEQVLSASKAEFEHLVSEGIVSDDTLVFNNLITTNNELAEKWIIPLKDSWHYSVFVG